jgi:archaemetzincin
MATIWVAAVGVVNEDVLKAAEMAVWHAYGHDIRRLDPLRQSSGWFDPERRQWNSSLILKEVALRVPVDATRLLVVTEVDLFIPMLSFVFGQAQLGGRAALVSSARLRPEFYGMPANEPLFVSRLVKEVIHEMGHTFGLVHCPDTGCPMSLSTSIRQVDQKGSDFCPSCLVTLKETAVNTGTTDQAERSP